MRRGRSLGGSAAIVALLTLWLFAVAPAAAAGSTAALDGVSAGAGAVAAAGAGSTTVIENPAAWDGRIVSFGGEVVGEPMERGRHAWLQVNDDSSPVQNAGDGRSLGGYNSGLAVWAPLELSRRVHLFGKYGARGDEVRVLGVFHAACREHGGDMDVHATGLEVVRDGRVVGQHLNITRLWVGLGLLACAGLLLRLRARLPSGDAMIRR